MRIRLLELMDSSSSAISIASSSAVGSTLSRGGDTIRPPEHTRHGIKQIYKIIELPFPEFPCPELADFPYFEMWYKSFVPSLLTWAGAHEDPFRANSELYTAVPHIWERVFPRITLLNYDLFTLVKVVSGAE
jgi:hypothetical protein